MEEDLLSKLPSDVLVSILEKLDLRDAVRAGVLSSRWRFLPVQLQRFALDIDEFLPEDDEFYDDHDDGVDPDDGEERAAAAVSDGYRDVLSEAGDKMADAAMVLLASRPAINNLDEVTHTATLTMRFYLRHNYLSLGRLLDDAVSGGKVHAAELTITTTATLLLGDDRESTERALAGYGRRFRALFDACPAAFGALTQLTLEKMRHGRGDLRDILATCTRLEKLYLFYCGPKRGGFWQVRHARLKDMRISLCDMYGVNLVWLPRLERFAFDGWCSTPNRLVSFGHVPSLTTVALSNDVGDDKRTLKLSSILASTSTIRDLRLNFRGSNIWVEPETSRRLTDAFRNLKTLKIRNVHQECGLAWTMFLLQSAPQLQQLYIKLMDHDCGEYAWKNVPWEVATSFEHYNLARATIVGFYSTQETMVPFIRHLVEAAVNLEEICIRENPASYFCEVCEHTEPQAASRFPRTEEDRDTFRNGISDGRSNFKKYNVKFLPIHTAHE